MFCVFDLVGTEMLDDRSPPAFKFWKFAFLTTHASSEMIGIPKKPLPERQGEELGKAAAPVSLLRRLLPH